MGCWRPKPGAKASSDKGAGRTGKGKGRKGGKSVGSMEEMPAQETPNEADICARDFAETRPWHVVESDGCRWKRFNYDTGAGLTVLPRDTVGHAVVAHSATNFRTSSSEVVEDKGTLRVKDFLERGASASLTGHRARVHTPLVSASDVGRKGRLPILLHHGSYIIPRMCQVDDEFVVVLNRHRLGDSQKVIKLYAGKGVYSAHGAWPRCRRSQRPACP